jgi:hypothetical protein
MATWRARTATPRRDVDTVTRAQLLAHRDRFVPARPVARLADVAPTLVVNADGTVVPLTHDIEPRLGLGSVWTARLASLAAGWIAGGSGDALAQACDDTWQEITGTNGPQALYWCDAVAARTQREFAPVRDRSTLSLRTLPNPTITGAALASPAI